MARYLWQLDSWPTPHWGDRALLNHLGRVRFVQGRLFGKLESVGLGDDLRLEVEALTEEAVKTAAIEGERLARDSARSSVARRLGLEAAGLPLPELVGPGILLRDDSGGRSTRYELAGKEDARDSG